MFMCLFLPWGKSFDSNGHAIWTNGILRTFSCFSWVLYLSAQASTPNMTGQRFHTMEVIPGLSQIFSREGCGCFRGLFGGSRGKLRESPGKIAGKIFPEPRNATNSMISGTGKGKPAGNLGSTLPGPCPHLPCGVFFEIDSSSLLEFFGLSWILEVDMERRSWAIAVGRDSCESLFLLNSGQFSLQKLGTRKPDTKPQPDMKQRTLLSPRHGRDRSLWCFAVFKGMNFNAPSIPDINPTRNNMKKNITRSALNPT